jgi:hypothetical protein
VFPALALGVGESPEGIMDRDPRDPKEPVLTRRHWIATALWGALIAASVTTVFFVALAQDLGQDAAVTIGPNTSTPSSIGAGQAGPAIAARCSREGLRTAVIERHHFGGTCVNVGCVPTKTLVASARAIRLAQRGAEFGFDVANCAWTWPA